MNDWTRLLATLALLLLGAPGTSWLALGPMIQFWIWYREYRSWYSMNGSSETCSADQ